MATIHTFIHSFIQKTFVESSFISGTEIASYLITYLHLTVML